MKVNSLTIQPCIFQNKSENGNQKTFGAVFSEKEQNKLIVVLKKNYNLTDVEIEGVRKELDECSKTIEKLKNNGKDPFLYVNPEIEAGLPVFREKEIVEIAAELPNENKRGVSEFELYALAWFRKFGNVPKYVVKNLFESIKESINGLKN